ncbi:MAG TPA: DUF349 domain-containing protein [Halomonas sp.]|nr:DUF349 domain-containing protein [Halomonas sp.]
MRGIFSRLFAPRWQHPSAEVRCQAIARLSPERRDHRQALERLALDPDADVRRAALARLDDIDSLLSLRKTGSSQQLDDRLVRLLSGQDGSLGLAQRIEYLAQLDDSTLFERLAMEGDNQRLRLEALAHLDDEDALIRLACDNRIAAVRHAAAARVESDAGLARLARDARRDGQVMRQARQRLGQRRSAADSQAEANAQREQLLERLETLAGGPWEPHYEARFQHFEKALRELGPPSAEQERRFREAHQRYRKTLNEHQHFTRAQEAARQRRQAAAHEREALITALEEALDALAQGEGLSDQEVALLRSHKQLLSSRWLALSEQHSPDDALRRRYSTALERYEAVLAARGRLDARTESIVQALSAEDNQQLAALIAACRWPSELPLAPLLKHAQEQLQESKAETAQDQSARLANFDTDLDRLQQQLDKGMIRHASRLHQRLTAQAEALGDAPAATQLARFKRLGARLAELRDWRAFVAGPKRQQLSEEIARLAEQTQLSDGELNRRHRQLVQDWKSLGDAAANRELSARFREASDSIRQRLQPWRERQADERRQNLKARTALCEQLEALLEQPDEQADPDALRKIRDHSRRLWLHHSPVPKKQAKAIERRFAHVRHALQALIERRASETAEAKRELIERLRALRDRDMDAHRRAEQAKAMQREWRRLGRAPKGEEQALWRDFRHLCDEIFGRRDAARKNHRRQDQQRLDAMQALIDQLDAWRPARASDAATLDAALKQAAALEPLPHGRRSEGMKRRWAGIVQARRTSLERLALAEEARRWQRLGPLIERHLAADAALLEEGKVCSVDADDKSLAIKLSADLRQAHERRNAARLAPSDADAIEARLTLLRVHLALLTHGRVSPRDEHQRLAIQVERLNQGLGQPPRPEQELRQRLLELLATGPVPAALWAREAPALDECMKYLTRPIDG